MGKRKERRLAAISAAGRRVKLDLFAEPIGEVVNEARKGEETVEQNHSAGVPDSPVNSDQKQENPLLLLGQYSDDEPNDDLDIESKIEVADELAPIATKENDHLNDNRDAESDKVHGTTSVDTDGFAEEPSAVTNTVGNDPAEHDNHLQDTVPHTRSPRVSDIQNAEDSVNVWKVLVDEPTGRYYYWNTQTGETSWEVPEGSQVSPTIESSEGYVLEGENVLGSSITHAASQPVDPYNTSGGVLGVSYPDALMVQNIVPLPQIDCGPSSNSQFLGGNSEEEHLSTISYKYSEAGEVDPDHLIEHGEQLITRLKSAERSDGPIEMKNWRLKCISELETRIFDCKALSSFGSSLLPFWWHCYTQLKRIEDALDEEESVKPETSELNENNRASSSEDIPKAGLSFTTESTNDLTISPNSEISIENNRTSSFEDVPKADLSLTTESTKDLTVSPNPEITNEDQDSKSMDNPCEIGDATGLKGFTEDVDMDVDMEVDEEMPVEQTENRTSDANEYIVPPPPDEWVPPPPPPEEDVTPPPPAEEPPPIQLGVYPSFSYPEQYNISYTAPALECYASSAYYSDHQATTVSDVPLVQPIVLYDVHVPIDVKTDAPDSSLEVPSPTAPVSSGSVLYKAEPTASGKGSTDPDPSTTAAVQSSGLLPSTIQSKVSRGKKRSVAVAPSLRSNKKVSSLVDKWKAAKEELHGEDEDEPENALEALERKRLKEIEQWKARQIASGEAQENANFVPLGGDWRERVKRRTAKKKPDLAVDEKKPDLASFAKGLPSGWEVYWDESSKSVYYANTKTAETSWSRPPN